MIKIPTYDNERSLSTGAEFMRPQGEEAAKDIKTGLTQLGHGLDDLGEYRYRMDQRTDKFTAEKLLMDNANATDKLIYEEAQRIPDNGVGFHDKVMDQAKKQADAILAGMPETQRAEATVRLQQQLNSTSDRVAGLEFKQAQTFIADVSKNKLKQLSDNVTTGRMQLPEAKAEADRFLTGIGLPEEQTNLFRQTMYRASESARLEYLRQQNPGEYMRQTQRFLPNSASDKASPIQRIIIEQLKAYGEDPRTGLIIGYLESRFDPNAPGKGTIKGLFQMTRSERLRIGARLGLTEEQMLDPAAQSAGVALLIKEARTRLEANGLPTTPEYVWAHHFLGPAGLLAFANAPPDSDARAVYQKVAGPRITAQAFANNGQLLLPGMTVGEVMTAIRTQVNFANRKIEKQGVLKAQPDEVLKDQPLEIMGEKFERLTPYDLVTTAQKATEAVVKQNNDIIVSSVQRARAAGKEKYVGPQNVYDASWRKAQDDAAQQDKAAENILKGDGDAIAKYAVLAAQTGYLPKPAAVAALNMINNTGNNIEVKKRGYEMLATVARRNANDPTILKFMGVGGDADDVGNNNAAKVHDYVNLTVHGGIEPNEAVRRVELRHNPDFKVKEADVKAEIEKGIQRKINWSTISQGLGIKPTGMLWWAQEGAEPPNEMIKKRIEEKAQDLYRFHRLSNETPDIAFSNTMADLKKGNNYTGLFGKKYMMPYPPEFNYSPLRPMPDDSEGHPKTIPMLTKEERQERFGYIADQAFNDAQSAAGKMVEQKLITKNMADKLTRNDLVLVPTGLTKRDVEAGMPSPRYTLAAKIGGNLHIIANEWRADREAAGYVQDNPDEAAHKTRRRDDVAPPTATPPAPKREDFRNRYDNSSPAPAPKTETPPDPPKEVKKGGTYSERMAGARQSDNYEDRTPDPAFKGQSMDDLLERYNKLGEGTRTKESKDKQRDILLELARRGHVELTDPSAMDRSKKK